MASRRSGVVGGECRIKETKIILSMERSPVLVLRLSGATRWPITCAGCAATGNRPGALSKRAPGRGFAAAQSAQIPGHRAAPLHQGMVASLSSGVVGVGAESRKQKSFYPWSAARCSCFRLSGATRWPITCAGCAAAPNRPGALSNRPPSCDAASGNSGLA